MEKGKMKDANTHKHYLVDRLPIQKLSSSSFLFYFIYFSSFVSSMEKRIQNHSSTPLGVQWKPR
ncbi:hypothetical protein HYC85_026080 [Camellia sinensis]|uniref:Uncharacterized protein n=1 Tax=Camellia sinensis TaxID=4442 RepID=A0A7J7G4N5_CAMSI|nr:hypothetical protein HYC85_026080 [Camellia sinensis]